MSTANTSLKFAAAALAVLVMTSTPAVAHRGVAHRVVTHRVIVHRPVVHRVLPQITAGEAARIRYQIQEHHQLQRRALADGALSRREQALLNRDAAQVRALIQTAKTN